MTVTVKQGHVLDVLPTIAPETFQTCVTSIPYYQLRAYGTPPQVWGGDPSCAHEWETETYYREGGNSGSSALAFSEAGPENAQRLKETRWRESTFCSLCGAWRGEWGQEPTPELYVEHTVSVFRAVWRVLRSDGTLWLNIGDTYWNDPGGQNGSEGWVGSKAKEANKQVGRRKRSTGSTHPVLKRKDMVGIPWRVAFALQADGWYLRAENIWHKPNPMPESCTDRPTRAHEQVFLLTKRGDYFYDREATLEPVSGNAHSRGNGLSPKSAEPGSGIKANLSFHGATNALVDRRNPRDVWTIPLAGFSEAHFATYPPELVERCIKAGTSEKGRCPSCRAPWERIVERTRRPDHQEQMASRWGRVREADPRDGRGNVASHVAHESQPSSRTVGWKPGCKCPAHEPVPCDVLDICGGSGTTGVVADRMGRNATLIELKADYAAMIQRRVTGDAPLFAQVVVG